MDQKWIQILVILMFYQKIASGADLNKAVKEGGSIDIECQPPSTTTHTIMWFRALDNSGMEFIISVSSSGLEKWKRSNYSDIFSKGTQSKQTVKSFKKSRDSGLYGCAALVGSELKFGKITRLFGEETKKDTTEAPLTKPPNNQSATKTTCDCNKNKKPAGAGAEPATPPLLCSILILAPLAGGCGLLLLLLIITAVYCNRIRTRRCPHHYKRKPRVAPEKQMMTNRHV
ncbi:T-cell surface glycoprotein CD8 alpha chain [Acanthochromis polyacanthus]|uniref:T-cell surface glycoprotein CD8 alpha chain n=1 Tax=Acanthochromis polyacanthus TaxID=80966 RepID=UPI002234C0B3|nr:T-cell surface glycoprotein CD8 alpha chain [Acanthochromis polyacanthus]